MRKIEINKFGCYSGYAAILGATILINSTSYAEDRRSTEPSTQEARTAARSLPGEADLRTVEVRKESEGVFLSPLWEFLGKQPEEGQTVHRQLDDLYCTLQCHRPKFLIATVPDPKESRFGYHFDTIIDAVQLALERCNYVQDRYYLPWNVTAGSDGSERIADAIKGIFRAPKTGRPWADSPGTVVFRKHGDRVEEELVVLFLVGETSTWGIQKAAFRKAFDAVRALQGEDNTTYKVIGPYFSGTAASLRISLDAWLSDLSRDDHEIPALTVQLCTGSATTLDKHLIERGIVRKLTGNRVNSISITLASTMHQENILMMNLIEFLVQKNFSLDVRNVALLYESGTSFGRNFRRTIEKAAYRPTLIPFPLHISDVRGEYDRSLNAREAKTPQLITPVDTIPVPFGQDGDPRDIVPSLWPKMTAPTDNLVLGHILSTISREGIRYLGVISSDTRDKIFLINLINQYCPDVQIFLTSNDLLLTNPQYSHDLQGAIVASTYPLFSPNQKWSYPFSGDSERALFAQESDEGCYNAILALLDDNHALLDYGTPHLFDEPNDAWSTSPPVWISIVGQHGPWPVKVVETDDPDEPVYWAELPKVPGKSDRHHSHKGAHGALLPSYSLPWLMAFLGITVACWYHYSAYRTALRRDEGIELPGVADANGLGEWLRRMVGNTPAGRSPSPLVRSAHQGTALSPFQAGSSVLLGREVNPLGTDVDRKELHRYATACFATLAIGYAYLAKPCGIPLLIGASRSFDATGTWNFVLALGLPIVAFATLLSLVTALVASVAMVFSRRPFLEGWGCGLTPLAAAAVGSLAVAGQLRAAAVGGDPTLLFSLRSFAALAVAVIAWRAWWLAVAGRTSVARQLGQALTVVVFVLLYQWLTIYGLSFVVDPLMAEYFAFLRTVHFVSGLSPMIPVAFLVATLCSWVHCQLRRMALRRHFALPSPCFVGGAAQSCTGEGFARYRPIFTRGRFIAHALGPPLSVLGLGHAALVLVGFVSILLIWIFFYSIPTVEGWTFDTGFTVAFGAACLLITVELVRFHVLRRRILDLFYEIAKVPLGPAFGRLPRQFATMFGRYLTDVAWDRSDLAMVIQQKQALPMEDAASPASMNAARWGKNDALLVQSLVDALPRHLAVLESRWRSLPATVAFGNPSLEDESKRQEASSADAAVAVGSEVADRSDAVEDFVAMMTVLYAGQFTVHLHNVGKFLASAPLLLLVATLYPFEPERLIDVFLWTGVLVVLGSVGFAYVQLERDEFVSRVSGTEPNKFTFNREFLLKAATFVLPVVGVLLTQFPDVSDFLYNYLGPLFQALR